MTLATLEFKIDLPGGKREELILFEFDLDRAETFDGAYKNCRDRLQILAEKMGGSAKISDHVGCVGRLLDLMQRALRALRN